MDIIYQKSGVVKVQDVNLKDPQGKPITLEVDFLNDTFTLGIVAWDNLNDIGRNYDVEMDEQFKTDMRTFFLVNIARVMREKHNEFKDLTLV